MRKVISLILIIAISGTLLAFSETADAYILSGPTTFLSNAGRNYHWYSVTSLADNSILLFTQNLTSHQPTGEDTECVSAYRGTDNGTAWEHLGNFFIDSSPAGTNCGLMTNGSVFGTVQQPNGVTADGGMKVTFSYDNGSSWSALNWFNGEVNNEYFPYCQPQYDEDSGNFFLFLTNMSGPSRSVWNSTDNGVTWTKRATFADGCPGYYTYGLRVANGNWTVVYTNSTSSPQKVYQIWSDDDCFTWSAPNALNTILSITDGLRNPQLGMGNPDTNENPYVLYAADVGSSTTRAFTIWNSSDCIHWSNKTVIDSNSVLSYSSGLNMANGDYFISYSHTSGGLGYLNYVILENFGDPPSNDPPSTSNPSPANGSTGADIGSYLSVNISDPDGDSTTFYFYSNDTGSWVEYANGSCGNCSWGINAFVYDLFETQETLYYWSINLTDGTDWTNETYHFTTRGNTVPSISNIVPANKSTDWSISSKTFSFDISDPEGDYIVFNMSLNVTGDYNEKVITDWIGNGTYYLTATTLLPNTNYTINISYGDYVLGGTGAPDDRYFQGWTNETFWFVTGDAPPTPSGVDFDGLNVAATVLFIAIVAVFSLSAIIVLIGKLKIS